MQKIGIFSLLLLGLSDVNCNMSSYDKKGLVIIDSLKYGDSVVYAYCFNYGSPMNASVFIGVNTAAKNVSYENALFRTNNYSTMTITQDSVLLIKLYELDTEKISEHKRNLYKIESTAEGIFVPERKYINYFPHK